MTKAASAHPRMRGFALIVVLWFLVLIGAIGTYLIVNARTETAIAHNIRAAAGAEALADAGIARAAFNQLDPVESQRWLLNDAEHRIALPQGYLTIRLQDETQKINPNYASDDLLGGLFEAVGVERNRARHLGAAIADWVGPDGPPRQMGAKLDQYRAAGKSYGPPNAPLETLDDLNLVLGMTPDILSRVRPYLTIYTKSEEPNMKGAPPVVQRAMAIVVEILSGGARQSSALTPAPPSPPLPIAPSQGGRLVSVEATGHSRDGGVYVRTAVLRLSADSPQGYSVLDWQRGSLPAEKLTD